MPCVRGVKITRVELKDVRLPVQLQRAMAAEAESLREAKAKLIAAEGEQKSAKALKEAAEIMCKFSILVFWSFAFDHKTFASRS